MAGAILLCALVVDAPAASSTSSRPLVVTGYIEDGSAPSAIDASATALSWVGVDGVTLNASGSGVSPVDGSMRALLRRAHRDGLRAQLLVSNYSNSIGDFSPHVAAAMLSSPRNCDAVASSLAAIVSTGGWDGLTVDLESLNQHDALALVYFLTSLRRDLAAPISLSVDVGAATSLSGYLATGFDLSAIGSIATRVVIMSYDQHGPWSNPGPIGALAWQRRVLSVAMTRVPARELDLGVAGYGYTWPAGSHRHDGTSVSDAGARRLVALAGAAAHFDPTVGEWTATLRSGTVLWWSDHRSFELRLALARNMGLGGVALWQLASSDPLVGASAT